MFTSLFWKEYRQQRAVVLSLVILCGLIQLFWCAWTAFPPFPDASLQVPLYAVAMFMTALFAASSTAIVFCNEHEEKTFDILRNQPISGALVAWAKIAWCLCAIFCVLVGTFLVSAVLHVALSINETSSGKLVFGVTGLAVLEGLAWGLFWSTRRKKQFEALLAAYFSTSLGLYLTAWFYSCFFTADDPFVPGIYAEAILFRLVLLIFVSIFAVRGAVEWLRKIEKAHVHVHVQTGVSPPVENRQAYRRAYAQPHQPLLALCWIAVQQSKRLILYAIAVHLVIAAMLWPYWRFFADIKGAAGPDQMTGWFVVVLGGLSALVFCGSVFWSDQKNNGTKLLIHSGVSPAKIWWSRILVFGAAYLIPAAILHLPLVVITWHTIRPEAPLSVLLLYVIVCYTSLFCIGQFCSLAIRRGILAVFTTLLTFILFYDCFGKINVSLGCSPLWTTIPMILSLLVASRLHVNGWAKNRNAFRAWRLPLTVIFVPILCMMIAIPYVRVYSVPIIDYGYSMEKIDQADLDMVRGFIENDAREYIREINPAFFPPDNLGRMYEPYVTKYIHYRSDTKREFDLESVLQDIAALSQPWPELQVIWRWRIRESYKSDAQWIKSELKTGYGDLSISLLGYTPWERARALRLLNNEFQRTMRLYDQLCRAVYKNERMLQENDESFMRRSYALDSSVDWYDKTYARHDPWMTSFDRFGAIPPRRTGTIPLGTLSDLESSRRECLLIAALEAWNLQHGSYPETLDELLGTYLERIPNTPFYEIPYIYYPNSGGRAVLLKTVPFETLLWYRKL